MLWKAERNVVVGEGGSVKSCYSLLSFLRLTRKNTSINVMNAAYSQSWLLKCGALRTWNMLLYEKSILGYRTNLFFTYETYRIKKNLNPTYTYNPTYFEVELLCIWCRVTAGALSQTLIQQLDGSQKGWKVHFVPNFFQLFNKRLIDGSRLILILSHVTQVGL